LGPFTIQVRHCCAMTFRPQRKIFPSTKLAADNAGDLELSSHRKAVASASAQLRVPSPTPSAPDSPLPSLASSLPPHEGFDDDTSLAADPPQFRTISKRPSQVLTSPSLDSVIVVSPTTSNDAHDPAPKAKKLKRSMAPQESSLLSIDDIDDPNNKLLNKSSATADIQEFFSLAPPAPGQSVSRMQCNLCA
jgi:hypothetical protein